jgi:hypothetical protein
MIEALARAFDDRPFHLDRRRSRIDAALAWLGG